MRSLCPKRCANEMSQLWRSPPDDRENHAGRGQDLQVQEVSEVSVELYLRRGNPGYAARDF